MPDLSNIRVAEYTALREEIQRKVDTQFQVVSLTLLVAGTFLSLSMQSSVNPTILLVYPILATFLAAEWTHKSRAILLIARYIREQYETGDDAPRWETYAGSFRKGRFPLTVAAAFGVFLGTQVLVLALALLHIQLPTQLGADLPNTILLGMDALCVLATLLMISVRP